MYADVACSHDSASAAGNAAENDGQWRPITSGKLFADCVGIGGDASAEDFIFAGRMFAEVASEFPWVRAEDRADSECGNKIGLGHAVCREIFFFGIKSLQVVAFSDDINEPGTYQCGVWIEQEIAETVCLLSPC
jgi:hypothetical protein